MNLTITGRVWKFGNHINTDYIAPGFDKQKPWRERKKNVLHVHRAFCEGFQPSDVIVAGKNFGCGSSRELAPNNLKRLGVGCIVAESFGRIFFRNCVAIALPVLACRGVSELFEEGDLLELDYKDSVIKNLTTSKEVKGPAIPPDLLMIYEKGGILELLKQEKKNA